ncbi:GPO family capsid scaffolding protein, partial [Collimonas sp.]|uniref:GPO family capsid scaffolding protein n=1 Tax=Collimonas sp. TaxID=1963772 RepID=UPI002C41E87D
WVEHLRSTWADGAFKAYGDVTAVKAEEVELGGVKKLALYAQIPISNILTSDPIGPPSALYLDWTKFCQAAIAPNTADASFIAKYAAKDIDGVIACQAPKLHYVI